MTNYLRKLLLLTVLSQIMSIPHAQAQEPIIQKYWVFFNSKENTGFDPYLYFDIKAIERRLKSNYPVNHPTDWPLNPEQLKKIKKAVTAVSQHSRWFNCVAVYATEREIEKINNFGFVVNTVRIASTKNILALSVHKSETQTHEMSEEDEELLHKQTERMQGNLFLEQNLNGHGMRVAIFDAGFPGVDMNMAFDHLRRNGRILKTWDFLKKKDFVYKHGAHGTMVLSCIAGKVGNKRIGLATEAEFLLARTESGLFEPFSEEENWLAASEWADKNGADIINSSLGYTNNRYFPSDMDGKKSLVTRAANMAAAKGMLVLNAIGNDGDIEWKYLGAPADADSVLSIGGISELTEYHIYFSSYGPTADMRRKPNVCAYGYALVAGKEGTEVAYGTSFSTPLVSGFAACAWQSNKSLDNMEIFKKIEASADLYPYYDYAHGYGVPQASHFTSEEEKAEPTFELVIEGNKLNAVIDKAQFDLSSKDSNVYFYYHFENNEGYLDKYYVLLVEQHDILSINIDQYKGMRKITMHFAGYTKSHKF
ncbi:MAG TPA: hypothetical protein EYN51_02965 [Flavobacteriales bacterium]|nr:hypothetical protein [Flavobacteriales bacterium]